jgi:hypothetical protein
VPALSPYSTVYAQVWSLLEGTGAAAVAYKATVAVGNRIRWTDKQPNRNPSRQPADVPVHEIREERGIMEAAPAQKTFCLTGKRRSTLTLLHVVVGEDLQLENLNYILNVIDACLIPTWPKLGLESVVESFDPIDWRIRRESQDKLEQNLQLAGPGGTLRLVARGTQVIRLLYDPTAFI